MPRDLVFESNNENGKKICWFFDADIWKVHLQLEEEPKEMKIPLPPFILIGQGMKFQIFAIDTFPRNEHQKLYRFPSPNIYRHGGICFGNGADQVLPAKRENMNRVARWLLTETVFNDHGGGGVVACGSAQKLWVQLNSQKAKVFPHSELIEIGTIKQVM